MSTRDDWENDAREDLIFDDQAAASECLDCNGLGIDEHDGEDCPTCEGTGHIDPDAYEMPYSEAL